MPDQGVEIGLDKQRCSGGEKWRFSLGGLKIMNAEAAVACDVGKDLRVLPITTSPQARLLVPYSASVNHILGQTEKGGLVTQTAWPNHLRL